MKLGWASVVVVAAFAAAMAIAALVMFSGRTAPTPAVFERHGSLAAAREAAAESGRPVLIFATADWCRYCQDLKRGPLAEATLGELIARETEPVYFEVTHQRDDPEVLELAQAHRVQRVPVLILMRGGEEQGRLTGMHDAGTIRSWLESGGERVPGQDGRAGRL